MKLLLFPLSLMLVIQQASSTAIGDLVKTMQPKTWAELSTTGFNQALLWKSAGAGDCIFNYSDDLTWNPGTEEVYYIGGSHYGPGDFVSYSAATNSWRVPDHPGWLDNLGHGYDHNALDPARGWFYHNPMSTRSTFYCWDIGRKAWRAGVNIPTTVVTWENIACCRGDEFFPDLDKGGLVMANGKMGEVYFFGTTTGKWRTWTNVSMASYHNIAKYDPFHKVVYLGGGNGETTLHKLDSAGNMSSIAAAPVSIGINATATTVDPVTGDILAVSEGGGFYSYHLESNAWTQESTPPTNQLGGANRMFLTCGPVSSYGVTMWCKYSGGTGKVWLYKRALNPNPVEAPLPGFAPGEVAAWPNPFHRQLRFNVPGKGRVTIYDLHGRMIARLAQKEWNAEKVSPGIYVAKIEVGTRQYSLKLLHQ